MKCWREEEGKEGVVISSSPPPKKDLRSGYVPFLLASLSRSTASGHLGPTGRSTPINEKTKFSDEKSYFVISLCAIGEVTPGVRELSRVTNTRSEAHASATPDKEADGTFPAQLRPETIWIRSCELRIIKRKKEAKT